jgi:hypothetical protein
VHIYAKVLFHCRGPQIATTRFLDATKLVSETESTQLLYSGTLHLAPSKALAEDFTNNGHFY